MEQVLLELPESPESLESSAAPIPSPKRISNVIFLTERFWLWRLSPSVLNRSVRKIDILHERFGEGIGAAGSVPAIAGLEPTPRKATICFAFQGSRSLGDL